MTQNNLLDEIYSELAKGNLKVYHIWLAHIVFTWRWWLAVALSIVPWILWIKIRNKNNTARLLFVGLVAMMFSSIFDTIGTSYNLWHYDWNIYPFLPVYFPWDLTLFPVSIMLMMQLMPSMSKYIKAVAYSFMCSFIFEPFFSWIGMYHMVNWEYWYSFIIYIPLYLFYDYLYKCKLWQCQSNS